MSIINPGKAPPKGTWIRKCRKAFLAMSEASTRAERPARKATTRGATSSGCLRANPSATPRNAETSTTLEPSSAQRLREKRQRHVQAVVDVGVRVVELFVAMRNARGPQPLRENARAIMNVVLIAPSAIDENAAQGA